MSSAWRPRPWHPGLAALALVAIAGLAGVGMLGMGLAGCVSPTLPLPPPEEPESMQALEGEGDATIWQISGTCLPGAEVTVFNTETNRGVVLLDDDSDGHYTVLLEAARCDFALVSQERDDEESAETGFVIVETQNGTAVDPSACSR
jgi:hypothetical protein